MSFLSKRESLYCSTNHLVTALKTIKKHIDYIHPAETGSLIGKGHHYGFSPRSPSLTLFLSLEIRHRVESVYRRLLLGRIVSSAQSTLRIISGTTLSNSELFGLRG